MIEKKLRSVEAVRADGDHGPLTTVVFEWLAIMEQVVNRPKDRPTTVRDWDPLAALINIPEFERIGNYGEQIAWDDYVKLLVMWANSSWWKGLIWRIWEIPGFVFCETEERSSFAQPIGDSGYDTLNSFCVYEFDRNAKVRHIFVYDQRPLDGPTGEPIVQS